MKPRVQAFFDAATSTATYLVSDPATRAAAVIDPVLDFEPKSGRLSTAPADAVVAAVRDQDLQLIFALETHAHADHLSAGDYLRKKLGAVVAIGAGVTAVQTLFGPRFEMDLAPEGRDFDLLLKDGDRLKLGRLEIEVLHTPGHTPACVTYVVVDAAFVGDTLLMPDYGTARADFPGGDAAVLYRSIRRILDLPPATRIFVGHDYLPQGRDDYRWQTTVAEQRRDNIHVREGVSESEFVALRRGRDAKLSPPALLLPSLQVNIRAGKLPPASAKGQLFLKTPVTLS